MDELKELETHREYVREVWKEANEVPDYGTPTFRFGKGKNENVFWQGLQGWRGRYIFFDLEELKEHLKELTPEKRREAKQFEQLRHLANGRDKSEGMNEFDKVIKAIEEEEKEKENQPN